MRYSEFCCQCCGRTNGDMYYDWFVEKHGRPPRKGDWVEYWQYRANLYQRLYEELKSEANKCNTLRGRHVVNIKRRG